MISRRDFLKLTGLLAGSTLVACEAGDAGRKLIPYLVPPDEGIVPGLPTWLRSTCTECPEGCGLSIKIMDALPVKLEGNPEHPLNRGALCMRGQASLERLFHPERLLRPSLRAPDGSRSPLGWDEALASLTRALQESEQAGLRNVLLTGRTTGTLSRLLDEACERLGLERLPELEILHHGALRRAGELVHGAEASRNLPLHEADLLVTLGADLLETFGNPLLHARRLVEARGKGLRWIHLEPHLTLTGLAADQRLSLRPGGTAALLEHLLVAVRAGRSLPEPIAAALRPGVPEAVARKTGIELEHLQELTRWLGEARTPLLVAGGAVLAGPDGLAVALRAALLQWRLSMTARTLPLIGIPGPAPLGTLADADGLAADLEARRIGVLLMSRLPPLGPLPRLAGALTQARLATALVDVPDPALQACHLLLPVAHSLESWGDVEVGLDHASLIQPALEPLHPETRSEGDVILRLLGRSGSYQEHLMGHWQGRGKGWVESGVHPLPPPPPAPPRPMDARLVAQRLTELSPAEPAEEALVVTPSHRFYDGRSRSLGLLREIPDPLASVSYGRWISISEAEAEVHRLEDGRIVELSTEAGSLRLPVRIQPDLPMGLRMVHLDDLELALPLDPITGELRLLLPGARLEPTAEVEALPVLSGSRRGARSRGILPGKHHHPRSSLYDGHPHEDYQWTMVVDLARCTGCSACVAACYRENNVPVVGPEEHQRGREMAWLRIQPYRDEGGLTFVPMMCQHCEYAPCEPVCPVYATVHNPEGLNAQVYNRCVGTRYCANNCPYKARRFNWFDHPRRAPLDRLTNPEVSERPKGVMEKCTFCLQRIRAAKDRAKDEGRKVRDGDVVPACAQTCPTGALVFGSLLDPGSRVAHLARSRGAYRVLEEIGTEPSVIYLPPPGSAHPGREAPHG